MSLLSLVPDGLFPMDEEQDKARKASTPPQDKSVVFGQSEEDAEDCMPLLIFFFY